MNRKLQLSLFIGLFAFCGLAFSGQMQIKDTYGLVLVNTGDAFQSAKKGQLLKAGDQVYVLDKAVVVLSEAQGCHVKIRHNALITLNDNGLCQFQQKQVKLMGTRFASAIGLVDETQLDAPSVGTGPIGGIVIEEEPIAINAEDTNGELTKPVDDGAFASLASKLAVPATVVGAVAFSALAGGGGVFGDNAAGDVTPDVNTSNNDEDPQESGETPETNPVSPS
ncbi:MAG: hypothetical protein OEX19_02875 [Gammaproteobacteria bacterium]|nr:hypothetical protein [Gammaproteobacteria bacterium]